MRSLLSLSLIVLLAASAALAAPQNKVACVAHRGASAYAPENTLSAFRKALEQGADYLECDVHLSSDGEMMVIHDTTLNRTTNGKGRVVDHTAAQIRALDAGSWFGPQFKGERVPTLAELFDLDNGKVGFVVEIKNGPMYYPGIEKKMVDLIRKRNLQDRVIVISFDHAALRKVHEIDPGITTGALYDANILKCHEIAKNAHSAWVGPSWELTTEEAVADAKAHGVKMNLWTVDDPVVMKRFIDLGVNALTTNKPDVLLKALGR
ncbi:MAG: glycerophosphodiester phosphodiesterase [Armatimonadetes bacterium]|nr:glycerophosphodiester phosphodiesterase [Armatimonadota bacterium]